MGGWGGSYHESQEKIMKMFIGKNCNSTKKTWQSLLFLYGPFLRDTLTYARSAKDRKIMDSRVPTGKFWQVQRLFFPLDLPRLGEAANLWSLKKKQFWRMEPKNKKTPYKFCLSAIFEPQRRVENPPWLSWKNDIWEVSDISDCWKKTTNQPNFQQQNSWIFIFEMMVLK